MHSSLSFKMRNAPVDACREPGFAEAEPVNTVSVVGVLPVIYENIVLTVPGAFSLPLVIGNLYDGRVLTFFVQTVAGVTSIDTIAPNTPASTVLVASAVNCIKVYGNATGYSVFLA